MKVNAANVQYKKPRKDSPQVVEVPDVPAEGPSVLWNGHFYDYSGYAKANREVLFRVANTMNVSVMRTGHEQGLISVDRHTRALMSAFNEIPVPPKAPLLRFFGPDFVGDHTRHRILWTMMETYKIHYDFVERVNRCYEELWTPTEWNRQVFVASGVKVPTRVMPLGVNTLVYRPLPKKALPPCRLLTSAKAGSVGTPSGYIFLTVGIPSFRKGFDVLVEAFDRAFRGRDDVHLVLAVTHSLPEWNKKLYQQFAGHETHIWTLEGRYNEHGMARIYTGCNAYVCASRGEGWNLPVCEAAACGLPVIVPDNTSHPEVVGANAWMFPMEGTAPEKEGPSVSFWYKGMPFAQFGKKSLDGLVERMVEVEAGGSVVDARAERLRSDMLTKLTWDHAARDVTLRLLEVQP